MSDFKLMIEHVIIDDFSCAAFGWRGETQCLYFQEGDFIPEGVKIRKGFEMENTYNVQATLDNDFGDYVLAVYFEGDALSNHYWWGKLSPVGRIRFILWVKKVIQSLPTLLPEGVEKVFWANCPVEAAPAVLRNFSAVACWDDEYEIFEFLGVDFYL